jgi:hypothetical protein
VSFEWSWKWKPPKNTEDRGGGWHNSCSVRPNRRARLAGIGSLIYS